MARHCSQCGTVLPPDRKHRYCRECHNAYMRANRHRYEWTPEARRKANARAYAREYQKRGKLIPQPCENAGPECDGPVEKHHDDYSKPLEVRWFCRRHHKMLPIDDREYANLRAKYAQTPPIARRRADG